MLRRTGISLSARRWWGELTAQRGKVVAASAARVLHVQRSFLGRRALATAGRESASDEPPQAGKVAERTEQDGARKDSAVPRAEEGNSERDRWGSVRVNVVESFTANHLLKQARSGLFFRDGSPRPRSHEFEHALHKKVLRNPTLRGRWGAAKLSVAESYARGELKECDRDVDSPVPSGEEGKRVRDRWGAVRVNLVESSEVAQLLDTARRVVRGKEGSMRSATHDRIVANRLPCSYPAKNLFGTLPGPASLVSRFQALVQEHGRLALAFHASGLVATLGASYAAIYAGMDIAPLIEMLPEALAGHVSKEAGTFAAAYIVVEVTGPPRIALTLAATPRLALALRGTAVGDVLGVASAAALPR